ncbi:MAG: hypothetical protein JW839_13000, partial [Candidatus Lokiarchaeota archaeon]|nr:hypothetical protein [Candidatus Lokiarchaeota archaeon]
MTGIFFYQARNGSALPKHLREVADSTSHRGKHRTWILEDASRFAAVFLNKPQEENLLVVEGKPEGSPRPFTALDGYIEARPAPAAPLKMPSGGVKTQVETATLLYKEHGIEAFSRIDGCFSVLINEGDGVAVARDPFGSNPLYYYGDDEKLVVASELKAFRGLGNHPSVVEPGTAVLFRGNTVSIQRFFDARSLLNQTKLACDDLQSVEKELRALLDRAVKHSMPGKARTASLLSGGLDSSVICALALNHVPVLDVYVASFGDSGDLVHARMFADRYKDKVRLHVVKYTLDDMLRSIPDVVESMETFDAALIRSALPMHLVCSKIDTGVDVLLTGEGSDELFAGY